MKLISILGLPGCGKTTLSKKISVESRYFHLAAGEIIKNYISDNQNSLSKRFLELYQKGEIIIGDELYGIFNQVLDKINCTKGIILDGFPRVDDHTTFLDRIIKKYNISKTDIYFIVIQIEEEIAIERINNRFYCNNCQKNSTSSKCEKCESVCVKRIDDYYFSAVRRRFERYYKYTIPMIEKLSEKYKVFEVDQISLSTFCFDSFIQQIS